ncbi:MAG: efflux RND transporter periplasmic adaptor subunit [Gemmatimonadaceae bacterium]|nr:efflux RND transporter periplasmic adaptor subunit [Gemmatimonadaceae bacterium]
MRRSLAVLVHCGSLALVALSLASATACSKDAPSSGSAPAGQAGSGARRGPGGGPGGGRGARVEPVQVEVVARADVARDVATTGLVEPLRTIGVVSQLAGVLESVVVEEGDRVRAGQVLARLAVPEIDAQLASAEVALKVAESAAERSASLRAAGVITVTEDEAAQAALASARSTRDQLRVRRGFATVVAPSDGVVLERRVEPGDVASPQLRLFSVADLSTLVVRVPVSELLVASLREGGKVAVRLDALPGREITGAIRRIFPSADSTTRLVPVEVALSGAAARDVKPGYLARAVFTLAPRSDLLLVPITAVLENPRGAVVFVVQGGKAVRRDVQRGSTYEGRVEITEGLKVGDSVVVAGATFLRDGGTVRVVSPNAPDAPAETRPRDSLTAVGQRPAVGNVP